MCLTASATLALDWCDPELCPNGEKHTACGNNGVSQIGFKSIRKFKSNVLLPNYVTKKKLVRIFHSAGTRRNGPIFDFYEILFFENLSVCKGCTRRGRAML